MDAWGKAEGGGGYGSTGEGQFNWLNTGDFFHYSDNGTDFAWGVGNTIGAPQAG